MIGRGSSSTHTSPTPEQARRSRSGSRVQRGIAGGANPFPHWGHTWVVAAIANDDCEVGAGDASHFVPCAARSHPCTPAWDVRWEYDGRWVSDHTRPPGSATSTSDGKYVVFEAVGPVLATNAHSSALTSPCRKKNIFDMDFFFESLFWRFFFELHLLSAAWKCKKKSAPRGPNSPGSGV
jgi:hypothetical protein